MEKIFLVIVLILGYVYAGPISSTNKLAPVNTTTSNAQNRTTPIPTTIRSFRRQLSGEVLPTSTVVPRPEKNIMNIQNRTNNNLKTPKEMQPNIQISTTPKGPLPAGAQLPVQAPSAAAPVGRKSLPVAAPTIPDIPSVTGGELGPNVTPATGAPTAPSPPPTTGAKPAVAPVTRGPAPSR